MEGTLFTFRVTQYWVTVSVVNEGEDEQHQELMDLPQQEKYLLHNENEEKWDNEQRCNLNWKQNLDQA